MDVPCALDEDGLDISSLDDLDSFDEPEFESCSSFDSAQIARSYWLGKKFLKFAQAYLVLQDSSAEQTITEVDVSFEERMTVLRPPLTDHRPRSMRR